ncbi:MAG: hypothetical protein ACR2G4_10850 [Pyrinomonadaceae bacterium]
MRHEAKFTEYNESLHAPQSNSDAGSKYPKHRANSDPLHVLFSHEEQ